jgi:hypothetical protein
VLSQQSQPEDLQAPFNLPSTGTLRTAAIVDRTANLAVAAADLVISRFAFNGRSPYSPDIILVNEFCAQSFFDLLAKKAPSYLGSASQQAKNVPKRGNGPSLLEQVSSEQSCRVIVSGTGWAVAQVQDR